MAFREDRFTWQEGDITLISPDQLQCSTCKFKTERTAKCEKFPDRKPAYVLDREKECPEYKKA